MSSPVQPSFQKWNNRYFKERGTSISSWHIEFVVDVFAETFSTDEVFALTQVSRCAKDVDSTSKCYLQEAGSDLNIYHNKQDTVLQPDPDSAKQCTVVLLSNLAEANWILVKCSDLLMKSIVCFQEHQGLAQNGTPSAQMSEKECTDAAVLKQGMCLELVLWDTADAAANDLCSSIHKTVLNLTTNYEFSTLEDFLQETSVSHAILLSPDPHDKHYVIIWEYQWIFGKANVSGESVSVSAESRRGILPCFGTPTKQDVPNHRVFVCQSKKMVSNKDLCEDRNICSDSGSAESLFCNCEKQGIMCRKLDKNSETKCSVLYYKNNKNRCQSFVSQMVSNEDFLGRQKDSKFTCESGRNVEADQVNDGFPDCDYPTYEDEKLLTNHHSKDNLGCSSPSFFPCALGSSVCFKLSDICIFSVNHLNNLIPCRTGSHVQNCNSFECNGHYKCQHSYCIPWAYTCNGKWDCVCGGDEHNTTCKQMETCFNMFKCQNSKTCVHLLDICDNFADCPNQDDEFLCEYHIPDICPTGCACLHLAVACKMADIEHLAAQQWSFVSVFFVESNLTSAAMFSALNRILVLNLAKNCLSNICFFSREDTNFELRSLDISFNHICRVSKHCFLQLTKLVLVNLGHNHLDFLDACAFCHLKFLSVINLKGNRISFISFETFSNLSNLHLLNLLGNPISDIDSDSFGHVNISYVGTEFFRICVILRERSVCPTSSPWYIVSFSLLPDLALTVTIFFMFGIVVLPNSASLFANIFKLSKHYKLGRLQREKDKNVGPYNIIVSVVNVGDCFCAMYLCGLGAANLKYSDKFVLEDKAWKQSFGCSFIFDLSMVYSISVPLLMLFLSFARLMVVKYPFESKFKCAKFVTKCLISIVCVSFVSSVSITSLCRSLRGEHPSSFCLPFVDFVTKFWETKVLTFLISTLKISVIVLLVISYSNLVREIEKSVVSCGREKSISGAVLVQLVCMVASNVVSWVPGSVIYAVCLFLPQYPVQLVAWNAILIESLCSVTNGVLFVALSLQGAQKKPVFKPGGRTLRK